MKLTLPVTLLLMGATSVSAQQAVTADAPAEAIAGRRAAPAAPPVVVAPEVRVAAPAVEARSETRETSSARVQQVPRNFWWLVGGIVLAGVILAMLL